MGLVTIAIKTKEFTNATGLFGIVTQERQRVEELREGSPEQTPFNEKQKHIEELCPLGFKPTEKDIELALFATYKEHGAVMVYKILLLQNASSLLNLLTNGTTPKDITNYISLLMFETELLF